MRLDRLKTVSICMFSVAIGYFVVAIITHAAAPSFDCSKVGAGSVEEMVCKDENLSALDLKMAEVYKEASKKAVNEKPPVLKAGQRGWIKGRDDCWKSEDVKNVLSKATYCALQSCRRDTVS